MNILIVDDNKNNRMILKLLLEDYVYDTNGVEFTMDEAVDGAEAIEMCDAKEYHIVFMDIMMPNIDGIEATKKIRKKNKKLMIIAVSAVDDITRQKSILNNGAEDYILKPVNADIFTARIDNYVSLIYAREHQGDLKKSNQNSINLFTKDIYSRYTNFILSSEDALSELWEYYLLDGEDKSDNLSDVIRTIFSISEVQLKLNIHSNLYVEESENFHFFTITKIDEIPIAIITLLLKKNEISCEYKINEEFLTFKLSKTQLTKFSSKEEEIKNRANLQVFDYLDKSELEKLEVYIEKLNSLMHLVESKKILENEVIELYKTLEEIASLLVNHPESSTLSNALSRLSLDISNDVSRYIQNMEALSSISLELSKDLYEWMEQSFHKGALNVEFMNDIIVLDCQTISSILKIDDTVSSKVLDSLDELFDF